EREVPPTTHHQPRLVAREVRGDPEEPRPRIVRLLPDRPRERLLRQILGPLAIPHLAIEKPDQVGVDAGVHLSPIDAHVLPERVVMQGRSNPPPASGMTNQ